MRAANRPRVRRQVYRYDLFDRECATTRPYKWIHNRPGPTAIFYTRVESIRRGALIPRRYHGSLFPAALSLCLTDDNVQRSALIRPDTRCTSYDSLSRFYSLFRHEFIHPRYLCAFYSALLSRSCTYYVQLFARVARVLCARSRDKYPRALQIPRSVIFARVSTSPSANFGFRVSPPAGHRRSITRIRYLRYPPAIIHRVYAYDSPLRPSPGSHALSLHHPRQSVVRY